MEQQLEDGIINKINEYRIKKGRDPIKRSGKLTESVHNNYAELPSEYTKNLSGDPSKSTTKVSLNAKDRKGVDIDKVAGETVQSLIENGAEVAKSDMNSLGVSVSVGQGKNGNLEVKTNTLTAENVKAKAQKLGKEAELKSAEGVGNTARGHAAGAQQRQQGGRKL